MPYTIPPFPKISVGDECFIFPGHLSSHDSITLERIHKELRAEASNLPNQMEALVCKALQQCYDMLKGIHAQRSAFSRHVLEDVLPDTAFKIALECGWLPEGARVDNTAWRSWIKQLLAGRFSTVGLDDSCIADPFLFLAFPVAFSGAEPVTKGDVVESIPSPSNARADATERKSHERRAFIEPKLVEKGWSVFDWATNSNVDFHTAADYLKGRTRPYQSTRKKLAESLGLDPQNLPS